MSDFSGGKGDHMIKLTDDDDIGWVDTHHGLQDEQPAVTDMSMGSEDTDVGKKGIYWLILWLPVNSSLICSL